MLYSLSPILYQLYPPSLDADHSICWRYRDKLSNSYQYSDIVSLNCIPLGPKACNIPWWQMAMATKWFHKDEESKQGQGILTKRQCRQHHIWDLGFYPQAFVAWNHAPILALTTNTTSCQPFGHPWKIPQRWKSSIKSTKLQCIKIPKVLRKHLLSMPLIWSPTVKTFLCPCQIIVYSPQHPPSFLPGSQMNGDTY